MCGICGYINFNGEKASNHILQNMMDAIAHRGPDGQGQYIDKGIAFGHRRLAIIDLSQLAKQPMQDYSGRYVLTYNGEIYNFKDIRNILEKKGYRFISSSDTEVVLYSYIEWGRDCIHYFNGMFAFSVYDKENGTVFLARDRYGIKPLYYGVINNVFMFASEQKAIYQHPNFFHCLDYDAITEYFTFQNIISNRTFEKGIRVLEPGHYIEFNIKNGVPTINPVQYWDFNFVPEERYESDQEYEEELDEILEESIKRQMVSDAPIGCFLSGGMDSGTITCVASRLIPHIHTFTCGYDMSRANSQESCFDERKLTEIMAHHFQTAHFERVLQYSDVAVALPKVCYHNEEPRVGMTYTNYTISELASKFVKVCFSGTGGDELFGGYPWRYYRGMMAKSYEDFAQNYYTFWQRLIPTSMIKEALAPVWNQVSINPWDEYKRILDNSSVGKPKNEDDYVNCMMYYEAKTFLHGMLMIEDKQTMAHSLESRVPMLDNKLVEYGMRLPLRLKLSDMQEAKKFHHQAISNGRSDAFLRTNRGKFLLRKCMMKYIPESISRAHKQGFSAPDATWFRDECKSLVCDVIDNENARIWEVLDKKICRSMVDDHMSNRKNNRLLIWSLLNFEQLLKTWY